MYRTTPTPDKETIERIAEQLSWSTKRVERWFFKRQRVLKQELLKKATETCWRCFIYVFLFVYGCFTLLPTDWFYDSRKWIEGYIREQPFTSDLKWYYLLELTFYTSLLFSQFFDHKRKDWWEMFIHHIATILLIFCSFVIGHVRLGVVIMFLHDASDYWLEIAKLTNYMKLQTICDGLFVMFAVTFYLTRWIYYPFVVLSTMTYTTVEVHGPFASHTIFTVLLYILQLLHIFWGYLIGKMIYQFVVVGKVEKDTRSEDEAEESDDDLGEKVANGQYVKKDQ